jgi:hypothetical protein
VYPGADCKNLADPGSETGVSGLSETKHNTEVLSLCRLSAPFEAGADAMPGAEMIASSRATRTQCNEHTSDSAAHSHSCSTTPIIQAGG